MSRSGCEDPAHLGYRSSLAGIRLIRLLDAGRTRLEPERDQRRKRAGNRPDRAIRPARTGEEAAEAVCSADPSDLAVTASVGATEGQCFVPDRLIVPIEDIAENRQCRRRRLTVDEPDCSATLRLG